jgi:CBS domain-containing protein
MTVGEVCVREVAIVRKRDSVIEAAKRMREYHVGNVVVVEDRGPDLIPVGILTDRDIVVSIVARDPDRLGSLVFGDVMTFELLTAREDESLHGVLKRMCTRGIRRIPVVNQSGGLAGIVAVDEVLEYVSEKMSDLVRLMTKQRQLERQERD